ncbi:MAG: putative N-acetyltransferase YjcF [Deltaproteobacteria bacterium]|jgi:putative N-acetyltransferase (TIGR04045 family)|nr:MAG: putative N-acetyltransferase YjcF [Deltaproteobacteria bacterium]
MKKIGGIVFKIAETEKELEEYFRLRYEVFVREQGIFKETDVDEYDKDALHIVAVEESTGNVVGGVRCYRKDNNTWFGGRLSAAPGYRNGRVGSNLVKLAVQVVKSRGCKEFLAYIQPQNVRFFERLGWRAVGEPVLYHGRPHQLMRANLDSD